MYCSWFKHCAELNSSIVSYRDLNMGVLLARLTYVHELDCQHTEDARFVMLDRLLGPYV